MYKRQESSCGTLGHDEISDAKWEKVDLVVLSACNTGGLTEYGDSDCLLYASRCV